MKSLYILLIVLFGLSQENQCQIITVVKNTLDPKETDIDTLILKDKTFQFRFDTLFYVNQILIKDYINTIDTLNYLKNLTKKLIAKTKEFNSNNEILINRLTDNMDSVFLIVRDSLALNNKRLDKWKSENSKLLSINNQITLELNDAKDQIRKEKWNSTGNKMLFGVGGVIVGIGLGSLIILAAK